jgi:predicted metal-binding protein
MRTVEFARQLGIETCLEFDPAIIVPEQKIRAFCQENICGNYGNNYTCPPYVGTLEEINVNLRKFRRGLLLQYLKVIDVKGNKEAVLETMIGFHNKVLQIEEFLRTKGVDPVWGMIGGNCGLCDNCKARSNEPCLHPDKARMSLEAIAVDVVGLLERLGLDSEFHSDKITWTGCILFQRIPG